MKTSDKNTDVLKFDVLVAGAGAAGIAAAIAAAKEGLQVCLIERNAYPGGKATAAYVGTICGLYYRSQGSDAKFAMEGFPKDFALEIQERSQSQAIQFGKGLHFLPYQRNAFIEVSNELLESNGVHCFFDTSILKIKVLKDGFQSDVKGKSANNIIFCKTLIDASGEAGIAELTGLPTSTEEEYQAAAQVFELGNLKEGRQEVISLALIRMIQKGISEGDFPIAYKRLSLVPGSIKDGKALFKLGIPLKVTDDAQSKKELDYFAFEAVNFLFEYLKKHSSIFKNSTLELVAPEVGVRTGRRHIGETILSKDTVLEGRKDKDSIARGVWPIEFWAPGENPRMEYFAEEDYYDIPAGTLISQQIENLFFAGRHISAEAEAIASARVIGTCLQTGYAAGKLAAGKVLGVGQKETVKKIQTELGLETK
ncbi:MAG: FAD-dependent oxidoreductase [Saprospiraceae bacterium]